MFAGKKSAQIREILISESAWEEMTCLFAPSLIDNLVYQQMAQVTLTLQFVFQHYKKERWIDSATVKANEVTFHIKGA